MSAADQPLSVEQVAERDALYRHLLALRKSGVRMAVLQLGDDAIGVRPVGRRVDVEQQSCSALLSPT